MKNIKYALKTLPIFLMMVLSIIMYSPPTTAAVTNSSQSPPTCISKDELKALEEQAVTVRLTALEICDFITPTEESRCKTSGTIKRKRICQEPHTATMAEVQALVNNKLRPAIAAVHATFDNKTFLASGSKKRAERKQKAWAEIAKEVKDIDTWLANTDEILGQPQEKLSLVEVSLDCHQIAWSALFISNDAYKARTGRESWAPEGWWLPLPVGAAPSKQ
jgi:hypothetical protein